MSGPDHERRSGERSSTTILMHQADELARRLEQKSKEAVSLAHPTCGVPVVLSDMAQLLSLLTQMFLPIFRSYNNGGLPARPAGKRFKFFGLEMSGSGAITTGFRMVILLIAVLTLLLVLGIKIEIGNGAVRIGRTVDVTQHLTGGGS